jgi:hypothetical protein
LKRFVKSMCDKEQGQVLILSTFILLISAVCSLVPIVSFMGTGIVTTMNTGLHTQEIYAAEAGVYDAMWRMIMIAPGVPKGTWDPPLNYAIDGGLNDKSVNVTLSRYNSFNFRIHSVAKESHTSHQSTVDTDIAILGVGGLDLAEFAKFAVTSNGTIGADYYNVKINGNIWIPDLANYDGKPPNGDIIAAPITGWPTETMLDTYYSYLVNMDSPYANSVIDISNPLLRGPLYAQGAGNYVLTGSGNLTGSLYIDGNLYFDQYAHVNLDGNTIYVTGNLQTHPQSFVGGPGAIISVGNMAFSPHVGNAYLLVMSVSGSIDFQPNGAFVGAVSGDVDITLRPNSSITWQDPGVGNLDLPGMYNHIRSIDTWSIH